MQWSDQSLYLFCLLFWWFWLVYPLCYLSPVLIGTLVFFDLFSFDVHEESAVHRPLGDCALFLLNTGHTRIDVGHRNDPGDIRPTYRCSCQAGQMDVPRSDLQVLYNWFSLYFLCEVGLKVGLKNFYYFSPLERNNKSRFYDSMILGKDSYCCRYGWCAYHYYYDKNCSPL